MRYLLHQRLAVSRRNRSARATPLTGVVLVPVVT
jgi:hypothetical protein